jgi:hypothetical protein
MIEEGALTEALAAVDLSELDPQLEIVGTMPRLAISLISVITLDQEKDAATACKKITAKRWGRRETEIHSHRCT